MKVLVTGAAGFIGSHVVRQLIERGHDTVAAIRPGGGASRLADVRARCEVIELELTDGAQTAARLQELRPDAIVHLAWYAEPGRYRHALAENVASARASAALLLAAAESDCRRVVLGGTCVENADMTTRPIYDAAKTAVHRLSEGFGGAGLSVACGHVFYLYGPLEDERRAIPSVIRSLLAGEAIGTTSGRQRRDYLHVADVAAGFATLAGTQDAGRVDICSGSLVALADVFTIIADEIGHPELLRLGELGAADEEELVLVGEPGPLHDAGWRPQFDLRAGIRDTITWWTSRLEAST